MKHPDMKQPKNIKGADQKGGRHPEAFDLWLKRGLNQIYGNVANEPIPDELLRLIEEDSKK